MANLLNSLLGQQRIPQQNFASLGSNLNDIYASIPQMAGINNAYNNAIALPQAQTQLGVEHLYDPNAAALRAATSSGLLAAVNRGGNLPLDAVGNIFQSGFQQAGASGLGPSGAGRNITARDLGLSGLQLENDSLNRAAGYTRSGPSLNSLFSPINDLTPGYGGSFLNARENAQNQYQQLTSQIKSNNDMNLIDRPLGLLSAVSGLATGGVGGGAGRGASMIYGGNGATPETAGAVGAVGGGSSM